MKHKHTMNFPIYSSIDKKKNETIFPKNGKLTERTQKLTMKSYNSSDAGDCIGGRLAGATDNCGKGAVSMRGATKGISCTLSSLTSLQLLDISCLYGGTIFCKGKFSNDDFLSLIAQ